jgi:hypothetical protein
MFTTDAPQTVNDLPAYCFNELKYQQPLLGHGSGAQGVNGFLASQTFSGSPAGGLDDPAKAGRVAGANPYEALADQTLRAATVRDPSYLPTGLHNAVYAEIYEGAL